MSRQATTATKHGVVSPPAPATQNATKLSAERVQSLASVCARCAHALRCVRELRDTRVFRACSVRAHTRACFMGVCIPVRSRAFPRVRSCVRVACVL